ncbi:carbohydrate esterase family 8 protein [Dacryopinax primogenitus]|uniref:pectinesterase n=1 Tax=Dacryopinax primogenitus (strain DJM 731) TaxID=1858805 RepID=M5FZH6_DACPD|nr:carbohydrate esterase family 8 protein [Dacryopinax primogenitus]EJU01280.1 carbohydrate esterase family 8 protein [Dacryopinax primogenitus]
MRLCGLLLLAVCVRATPIIFGPRVTPPLGAAIVRLNTTNSHEYPSVQSAVDALPQDNTTRSIFIYPGTYSEAVYINRTGPTYVYGYTRDASTWEQNEVTITRYAAKNTTGSDDASGTVRVHKDRFGMYNINLVNTFGESAYNGQALALSAYGNEHGYYGMSLKSYQDTLLANTGTQFYSHSYIEGVVDFIFGQEGRAFITKSRIGSAGPGCVTASGRDSATNPALYVLDQCEIVLAEDAEPGTSGKVYLGRPWHDYAAVSVQRSYLGSELNPAGWSIWDPPPNENIDHVTFVEYENYGPGKWNAQRANFSMLLNTSAEDAPYTIGSVLGSDYLTWVDQRYL